jgi:hypothetical protein
LAFRRYLPWLQCDDKRFRPTPSQFGSQIFENAMCEGSAWTKTSLLMDNIFFLRPDLEKGGYRDIQCQRQFLQRAYTG